MSRPAAPSPPGAYGNLWALVRPPMIPLVAALPLLGLYLAHWDRALRLVPADARVLAVMAAWVALHAGTLWLNAALDRDEAEVLYGRPAAVPEGASAAGYGALGLAVVLASVGGLLPGLAGLAAALLAVGYSHPAVAWKGHAVLGPAVNVVGYGLLSPLAGWWVAGVGPSPRSAAVLALVSPAMLGLYFAAQAFQGPEDAARGYRTLVVTHGPRACLGAARALIGLTFAGLVALTVAGWIPWPAALVAPAAWVVDRHLARWMAVDGGGSAAWARGLLTRSLGAFLLFLGLVLGHYGWSVAAGGATAGLATPRGWPADRADVRQRAAERATMGPCCTSR